MATTIAVQAQPENLNPSHWTTSQELCLLQSLTKWKPVGMHKNFRMLSVLNTLWSSGTIPEPIADHPHVSTAEGVWAKLESLYDLKALDEREDSIVGDGDNIEYWREFELAENEFGTAMWDRRLADEEEVWSDDGTEIRRRESTIADSDDPRSSPVGSVRGTRASGRRAAGRRLAEVKQDGGPGSTSGRASRRTSKAASPSIKDEADTIMVDADDNDDDSEDDEEESEVESAEDESRKEVRVTRGRGGRRGGRVRRGRRGK